MESPSTCAQDCPVAKCGNRICDPGETDPWNISYCPQDCQTYGWCGDGICGPSESQYNCPQDCGAICGDGRCAYGETPASCPSDCGYCGNGICDWDRGESCSTCSTDCGTCKPYCGNYICDPGETAYSCPSDCGYAYDAGPPPPWGTGGWYPIPMAGSAGAGGAATR
jgi:hypothetical protein